LSLKHAILLMLEHEPSSGYDLLKQFRESLGYFWNAKHQQIYRQLKQLSDEKLITHVDTPQAHKPDKKVYRITTDGQSELYAWLSSPTQPNKINDGLLVKIYGADVGDPEKILEELERHIALHQHTLGKLKAIEERYLAASQEQQQKYRYPYITLRRGILGEEAWLKWAEEASHLFKK